MEYANDAAAQAAYPSSDTTTTATVTQSQTGNIDYQTITTANTGFSQGFKTSTTENISKFTVSLTNVSGLATGTLTGYIYSDDGDGKPNASLATFSTLNVATITTDTYTDYEFTGNYTPTIGTQYHVVLLWTSAFSLVRFGIYYPSAYADGRDCILISGVWTGYPYDCYFKVYQDVIHLQSYSEATIKQQGSYSLKGIATITTSLNDTLTRTVSPTIDLTGKTLWEFYIYSTSRTGSNIKLGIKDSGGTSTETTPNVTSTGAWQKVSVDISAVANANKDAISEIKATIVNADATNTFYLDNMYGDVTTTATPPMQVIWIN